jgi:hypothetical protein
MFKFWFTVLCALFGWFVLGAGIGIVSGFWFIAQAALFLLSGWVVFGVVLAMLQVEGAK